LKEAILIQCHKNPEQVNMLINALDHPNVDVYVHVDKKSDIIKEIKNTPKVFIIPEELRVDVQWATFSQVFATLNLMYYASQHDNHQHYWLCSGQDFPIKPINDIVKFLQLHPHKNFLQMWSSFNFKSGGRKLPR